MHKLINSQANQFNDVVYPGKSWSFHIAWHSHCVHARIHSHRPCANQKKMQKSWTHPCPNRPSEPSRLERGVLRAHMSPLAIRHQLHPWKPMAKAGYNLEIAALGFNDPVCWKTLDLSILHRHIFCVIEHMYQMRKRYCGR